MDQEMLKKMKAPCPCGSGKAYGMCCGKEEKCPCGSGKMAKDCCMKAPGAHGMDDKSGM